MKHLRTTIQTLLEGACALSGDVRLQLSCVAKPRPVALHGGSGRRKAP